MLNLFKNLFRVECPGLRPIDPSRFLTRHEVYSEISRLLTLNQDQDGQIRELLARRALTDQQWGDYERVVKEHRELVYGQAEVIGYLRARYPDHFRMFGGEHQGKGFWEILMGYLKGGQ